MVPDILGLLMIKGNFARGAPSPANPPLHMMGNAAVAADMRREFITRPRLAVTVANIAPAVDRRGS